MRIRIDGAGEPTEIDVDLSLDALTMRESARLEELLGQEVFDQLASGEVTPEDLVRPALIQKLLYVKLRTQLPELTIDGFDVDLEDLNDALTVSEAEPGKDGGSSSG